MTDWLATLAPYYDYGWFITLLAWTAAVVIWRQTARTNAEWTWLPWAAAAGIATAATELLSFILPRVSSPNPISSDYVGEDVLLGFLSALAIAGWIRTLPARVGWRILAVMALFAVAGLRLSWPELGGRVLAVTGTVVAATQFFSVSRSRGARWAVGFAAVALWFTSAGPLAESQPRRLANFSELSAVWSGVQATAAMAVLASLAAPWLADRERRREWRIFLFACALWLVLGLVLAATMSQWARRNFEMQALGRTKAAAALMDKSAIVELLTGDFPMREPIFRPSENGVPRWDAHAPRMLTSAGQAVRRQLAVIEDADPEVRLPAFYTLRQGWIVAIVSAHIQFSKKNEDRVGLFRDNFDDDLADWHEKAARFVPVGRDRQSSTLAHVRARAPVVAPDGRMLGWLVLRFPRSDWLEAQAQPRIQAYIIVGLGLGLATLVVLQRVRTRERETARAAAMAATEADHLKTSFLAKVSHELRTPIQSVLGYSDLLRSVVTEPVARGRLKALRQHGELMLRLVNDLLDLSAIQAGAFRLVEKPTALVELVTQTVDSLRPRAEAKGLVMTLSVEPAVPSWAEIDGGRVRQVIINLVGNAVKFTDRGRVTVALARSSGENEIRLTVSDTGPGIAAADMGRLFHSFERLDATAAKEGTGLGLALSAALCRGMKGSISVESVEGVGATFTAWFRAPACEALAASSSSAGLPALSGRRILLADDNALVRELFVASLTDAGATCVAVEDGVLAIAAAQAEKFDAIVLDLAMPRLGGVEAAKKLRAEHGRTVRIIGLSAHAGQSERNDALGAGMDAFLVKPVNLDELVAALVPVSRTRPPIETGRMELLERLRVQFRGAAAAEGAALAAAITARDYVAARARAHHLMNSAAVVRDDWLYAACASVERAAIAGDFATLQAAWQTCEAALEPWTRDTDLKKNLSAN